MADTIITIPTFGHLSSVNLGWHSIHFLYTHTALSNNSLVSAAQALNIIGYEIWKNSLEVDNNSAPRLKASPKRWREDH